MSGSGKGAAAGKGQTPAERQTSAGPDRVSAAAAQTQGQPG